MIRTTHRLGASTGTSGSVETAGLISSAAPAALLIPVVGPFVSAAILVAAGVVKALGIGNGCGGSCVEATQVVNTIIPVMQQNLAAAQAQQQSNGGCLTSAEQSALLANFDQLWATIVQDCTQIGGDGGSQCISDRQRGGKYDCFVDNRDPISAMSICPTQPTQTAAGIAAGAVQSITNAIAAPATSTIISGVPDLVTYIGLGLLGFLAVRELS